MSTSTFQNVADQNPVGVPLYTLLDVARYLHVPTWTAIALVRRHWFHPHPEFFFDLMWRFPHRYPRDDVAPDDSHPALRERITFRQFAEVFVRAFVVQSLTELEEVEASRQDRGTDFAQRLWEAAFRLHLEPVLFGPGASKEGVERLLAPFAELLEEADVRWMRKWLLLRLERVEVVESVPVRLYPFSRSPAENSPRTIVMDPQIRFGRPTLAGHGIPTDILFQRHQAGDSVAELTEDYGLTAAEVEEAIRYEAIPPTLLFPFFDW